MSCPRLAGYLAEVRNEYPDYHARPVAPFGDTDARLLIVGLAPGLHGANASGRPFTGDFAGILLYNTLFKYDFSSAPVSISRDYAESGGVHLGVVEKSHDIQRTEA